MKISAEMILDRPREQVWEAFDNPDNMIRWQPTLESFEHVSGEPGQPGAVSRLVYQEGGRTIEMTERLTERREPEYLAGEYETEGTINTIENHFQRLKDGRTRWVMNSEFNFSGLFKLLAPFMKGQMRKRTLNDMERFKAMVEGRGRR